MTQRLGKYTLLRELGRGAYGTVYLARDTVLEVERAVKVLHPVLLADPTLAERFHREAKLAARLEHPHIVPVYDFGEEGGRFYLAMRYMPGGSLKERLEKSGALPWAEALRIARQVAEGLAYAHERGVVHRDLKPGNILFDDRGNAAIADFGFAKAVSGEASSMSLTATGGMIGTPPYMAPELWKNKDVGPAVDQYALACIVVEMLTGKVLFAGETPPEVMMKHVMEAPPLPAQWPNDVPAGVSAVLQKALAKDPAERYSDVLDLMEALTEGQVTEPAVPVRPPGPLFLEHGSDVNSIAISPDGRLLASGADDGTVRLWRVSDGALLRTFFGTSRVNSVTFLPQGDVLASGAEDGVVRLWRVTDGELMGTLEEHATRVNAVACSSDGMFLASGADDGTVRLWQVMNGTLLSVLHHPESVTGLAFSPAGGILATASCGARDHRKRCVKGEVRLWNVADGHLLQLLVHRAGVRSVAFSPAGDLLAAGTEDRVVQLWRVFNREPMRTLEGHTDWVRSIAFSPRGDLLASSDCGEPGFLGLSCRKGKVRLWRVNDGAPVSVLEGHQGLVASITFSPDGTLLASGSWDGTVRLWGVPR